MIIQWLIQSKTEILYLRKLYFNVLISSTAHCLYIWLKIIDSEIPSLKWSLATSLWWTFSNFLLNTFEGRRVYHPVVSWCSHVRLFAILWTVAGSSVHWILQARMLEWVAFPSPGDLPNLGLKPMSFMSPALAGGSLPLAPPGKPVWHPKRI